MIFDPIIEFKVLQNEFEKISGTPPTFAFHYTDSAGANGIVNNGIIWATLAPHSNDKTELKHARKIISKVVRSRAQKIVGNEKIFLEKLRDKFLQRKRFDFYVASFSSLKDNTSQYQKYCKTDPQFCLAFDTHFLVMRMPTPVVMSKIVYSESKQKKITNNILTSLIILLNNSKHQMGQSIKADAELIDFACKSLEYLLPLFKSSQWSSEKETRLVFPRKLVQWYFTAKVFRRNKGKVLYIQIPIASGSQDPMALTDIYYNSIQSLARIRAFFKPKSPSHQSIPKIHKSKTNLRAP